MLQTLLYIALLLYGPVDLVDKPLQEFKIKGAAQGTTFLVTYYAYDSVISAKQIDSIFSKIDSSLSRYKSYSLISQFNLATDHVVLDEHLRKVVLRSLDISKATKGLSDITVYPLINIWQKATKNASQPPAEKIKQTLSCVGANNLYVSGNKLFKRTPCTKIDVDGIAQGYSVDVICEFLERQGLKNYLVEVGGELRVSGVKPGNSLFKIGIEGPAKEVTDEPVIKKTLAIPSGAITTSGNYRKFFLNGNKRLSHIIDPKTGSPIENELISVTIYAPDAITADGYDNALLAMGLNGAFNFLKRHKQMEAYFIFNRTDGSVGDTATRGFTTLFTQTQSAISE